MLDAGGDVLTEVGASEPRGAAWDGKCIPAKEPQGRAEKDESKSATWESGPGDLSRGAACGGVTGARRVRPDGSRHPSPVRSPSSGSGNETQSPHLAPAHGGKTCF